MLYLSLFHLKIKEKLSLCLTNSALRHEDVWRSGYINSCILDLGISLEVSNQLHASAVFSRGKRPRYPLERRLGGPRTGPDDMKSRKILPLSEFELRSLDRPTVASRYTDFVISAHISVPLQVNNSVNIYNNRRLYKIQ
jgi:hypothetical protein